MKTKSSNLKEKITREVMLPENTTASIEGNILTIKASAGEVSRTFGQRRISISVHEKKISLESSRSSKEDKKMMGSVMAHIRNMLEGSHKKHNYTLKICSGHFPMNISVSGNKFIVKNFLGEKVPRTLVLKHGADVKIEGELIHVTSTNKETAGQVSADIEQLTRRPGYDSRVFQDGCYIISKDGRELK